LAGLKASVVLVPPKPNELFSAIRIFAGRGLEDLPSPVTYASEHKF